MTARRTIVLGWISLTAVAQLLVCNSALARPPVREPLIIDDIASQFYVENDGDGLFDEYQGVTAEQVNVAVGGHGNGMANRAATEFDTSLAGNPRRWQRVVLRFQTHSNFGNPILEAHGFLGNGSVSRLDVLENYVLYSVPITSLFNEVVTHEVEVTDFAKQAALVSQYVGFSFRVMDDLTGLFGGYRGLFIFAPSSVCTSSPDCLIPGPQLLITLPGGGKSH